MPAAKGTVKKKTVAKKPSVKKKTATKKMTVKTTQSKKPVAKTSAVKKSTEKKTTATMVTKRTVSKPSTIQDYVKIHASNNGMKFETTKDKGKVFEDFTKMLLKDNGYKIRIGETETSGDHGIDLVVTKTKSVRSDDLFSDKYDETVSYIVQCKYKESGNIGEPIIRDLAGTVSNSRYKNPVGMCVTTGEYTVEAKNYAKKSKIMLLDGKKLLEMYNKKKKEPTKKPRKTEDSSWW